MSGTPKTNRRNRRDRAALEEPEPQVTDPETRERIRAKDDADALDESGGPLPQDESQQGKQPPMMAGTS